LGAFRQVRRLAVCSVIQPPRYLGALRGDARQPGPHLFQVIVWSPFWARQYPPEEYLYTLSLQVSPPNPDQNPDVRRPRVTVIPWLKVRTRLVQRSRASRRGVLRSGSETYTLKMESGRRFFYTIRITFWLRLETESLKFEQLPTYFKLCR